MPRPYLIFSAISRISGGDDVPPSFAGGRVPRAQLRLRPFGSFGGYLDAS
jgi:hypothetical protein